MIVLLRVVGTIGLAIVTTLLSLRLLGIRRGWGTALLAALIGWGTAMLVAVGLNGWDWDADEMVVHLLAIGIPASMAAAVTLDLLARPGSLALGERAGLVVAPRPLRALRRRVSVLRRYRERGSGADERQCCQSHQPVVGEPTCELGQLVPSADQGCERRSQVRPLALPLLGDRSTDLCGCVQRWILREDRRLELAELGTGSGPSSSASTVRPSWNTRNASACRPARYSANISWPRSHSPTGCPATSTSRSLWSRW